MFYSHEILCVGTGSLAILWLAATKKPSQIKRLLKTNLIACLDALNQALPTLALRLQAALLLGAIRIYVAQISSLFTSTVQLKDKICLNVTSKSSTVLKEEEKKSLEFGLPLHAFDELPRIESFSLEDILGGEGAEGNEISRATIEASLMEIEASRLGGRSSLSSTGSSIGASLNARLSSSSTSMQNAFGFDWNSEIPPIGTQLQDSLGGGGFPEQETTIQSSKDSSSFFLRQQEKHTFKAQKRPFDRIIEIPNYISQAEAFSSACKERWNRWQKAHNLAQEQAKILFPPPQAPRILHSPERERREESSETAAAGSGGESLGGGPVFSEDWPSSSPPTKGSSEKKLDFSPAITRRASFSASPLSSSLTGMQMKLGNVDSSEEYPLSSVGKAKEAAELFFRLLIMASSNLIRLEQRNPYAPIRVISIE